MNASSIGFVHLGLMFPHVGQYLSIFGYRIAYYGIVIAAAMLAGIGISMWVAKKTGQDPDLYFDFAVLAILVSVIGARIYYVVFSWDYYGAHPLEIFDLRGGGLAIYGGVIAGVTTCILFAHRKHQRIPVMLDTACIGLILGQVIGRWGNFFNREAFGGYTDGLFAMLLPVEALRSTEVTDQMLANSVTLDGVTFVQVHPTFLYESMWNLGVLVILLIVTLRVRKRAAGDVFLLYLMGYSAGRLWIEGLRTDQLLVPGTGLAVSQLLSGVLLVCAAGIFAAGKIRRRHCGNHEQETQI